MNEFIGLDDIPRARDELSRILKAFVKQGEYQSECFTPHCFRVITGPKATRLQFEISPTKEKITVAQFDGKVFKFLPQWQWGTKGGTFWTTQRRLEKTTYDILFNDGVDGITDSDGILPIILEEVVTSLQTQKAWCEVIGSGWIPSRHDNLEKNAAQWEWYYPAGPGPWYGPLLGKTKCFRGEYPYVLDVEKMRILRPDIAMSFLGAVGGYKKRFLFEILEELSCRFSQASPIPRAIKKEFHDMRRLLDVGEEVCKRDRADRLDTKTNFTPSLQVGPVFAKLLAESKDGVVRSGCRDVVNTYAKYIDIDNVAEESRELLDKLRLGHLLAKTIK
ncbi:MAG: hypothetical protein ABSD38_08770 [Syntrophorhabdales bacterium]|jgi:hypothetical protein